MKNKQLIFILFILLLLSACSSNKTEIKNPDFESGLDNWESNLSFDLLISNDIYFDNNRKFIKQNDYFLTTKNISEDVTITSSEFILSGTGYISFLISGDATDSNTFISLVDAKTNEQLDIINNTYYDGLDNNQNFLRFVWDVSDYLDKLVYIQIVDNSLDCYINVDAFDTFIESQDELNDYRDDALMRLGTRTDDLLNSSRYYVDLNSYIIDDTKRYTYHVMGEIGWINDPNGFVYYNDEYHLFYQHNPYSPLWGPMHWGHVVSDDLVKWEYLPIAVAPIVFDAGGGAAFSGSAIDVDGDLYIMYTENWMGYQYQVIAKSEDGINFEKINDGNAVIDEELLPFYANPIDFRDPKIFKHEDTYYAVVGSRQINNFGQVLLFSSSDLTNWEYVGPVIQGSSQTLYTLGYMFECPDLFELDGKDILIMSPQQIPGHRNVNGTVYVIGNLEYSTGVLNNWELENIKEIDYGFDFYAPQTMIDSQGRRIMVAWMQSWNRNPMTAGLGWAGAMTFPREISLNENDELIQYPIIELENYRSNEQSLSTSVSGLVDTLFTGNTVDIELTITPNTGQSGIILFSDSEGEGTKVYYEDGYIYLDRTGSLGGRFPGDANNITKAPVELIDGEITLRILLDRHSIEVFVNDGAQAITSTVYYMEDKTNILLFSDNDAYMDLTKWDLIVE